MIKAEPEPVNFGSRVGISFLEITFEKDLLDHNFSSIGLDAEMQKAIDMDKQIFSIEFVPWGISANGIKDYYQIHAFNVVLDIKYEIPG